MFISSEALIFISGDRAPFFFINLSAIFVILFSKNLIKLRLITLLGSIFLIITISFINPTAKERIFDRTISDMNIVKNDSPEKERTYIFSKAHNDIYISAYKMFLDNKIIGVGVKNFRNICHDQRYYVDEKKMCTSHPHNTYLQILTETGLIGFLFLISTFTYFCIYVFKHFILRLKGEYYFTDFEICILSAIIIYLWPLVPTGNVFNNWLNIALILNLPFLVWSRKSLKTKS